MYCIQDPEAHLKGTMSDAVLLNEHSYLIYEIFRCHEAIRNKDLDPECAKESEIDDWTRSKKAMFRILDSKMNFNNFTMSIRQSELFMPSIPLSKGSFSDTGYRFRKNIFNHRDDWGFAPE